MKSPWIVLAGAALALVIGPGATEAAEPLDLSFDGIVEPRQRVAIANQVNGVVSKIFASAGQAVQKGEPLFLIDPASYEIDVAEAQADLDEARAKLRLAEDVSTRQNKLADRGVGATARAAEATFQLEAARATLAKRQAILARAELALSRTRVIAPIGGIVGSPRVSIGSFVEAEGGTILGDISQLDPVLVGYQVSYKKRQQALAHAGVKTPPKLFESIELALELPSGEMYSLKGKPIFESAVIDGKSGTLTTWAEFPNPNGRLVPGLAVRIISTIRKRPVSPERAQ